MKKRNLPKITTPRDIRITKQFLRTKSLARVYGGSTEQTNIVTLVRDMRGHLVGEFSLTKKLGNSIHDSARNKKQKKKNNK
jgi:ribosomal protein S19